ncbi:AraC family transcriptional regulator [Leifsonia lichenia]
MTDSVVQSFDTNDLEEAIEVGSRLFSDHRVVPRHANASFSYSLRAAHVGTATVGQVRYGCEVSVDIDRVDDTYAVSVPSATVLDVRTGAVEYTSTPELATISGPTDSVNVRGWAVADDVLSMVWFDRRPLEADLGRLLGIDAPALIEFPRVLDLRTGRGAEWYTYARAVFDALDRSGALSLSPLITSHLSSVLSTGLLLAADHQFRTALDAPAAPQAPAAVRRAVRFIDENAQEPITVPDIAASVGSSVRALNRGFKEHVGTSPFAYLIRVRMDGAHRELVSGDPEFTSVSRIAAAWGFYHFGRFALRYREQFGVSPSETLRRSARTR